MNKPLVSIIVPIYNVDPYLEKCLLSIKNQTYIEIEVLLINDGSTDNSINICKKFSNIDKRFTTYDKKNEGAAKSRNYGIYKAKGDYLYFIDADDIMENNMIQSMVERMMKDNSDICVVNAYRGKEGDFVIADNRNQNEKYPLLTNENKDIYIIENLLFENSHRYAVWNRLYSTKLVKENNIFFKNHRYAEDLLFNIECLLKANFLSYINNPLYYHYQRPNSVSNSLKPNIMRKLNAVSIDCEEVFDKNNMSNAISKIFVYLQLFFMGLYNEIYRNENSVLRCNKLIKLYFRNLPCVQKQIQINQCILKKYYNKNLYLCIILIKYKMYFFLSVIFSLRIG